METEFKPNYAIHPGEILKEDLEEMRISQADLADITGLQKTVINEVIKGKRKINHSVALALEPVMGYPASFWMNLQSTYDETIARLKQDGLIYDLRLKKESASNQSGYEMVKQPMKKAFVMPGTLTNYAA